MANLFREKLEISQQISCISINDWDCQHFHACDTQYGTSYNSYIIMDKYITLIDCIPMKFSHEFQEKIKVFTPFDSISYIVIQHAEQECSECLPYLLLNCVNAKVVCTRKCFEHLVILYPTLQSAQYEIVNSQSELMIGEHTLSFRPTPLIHWPEQMITKIYNNTSKTTIFSTSDLFSQHYAITSKYVTEQTKGLTYEQVEQYAANVFGQVIPKLKQTVQLFQQEPPAYILPMHGCFFHGEDQIHALLEIYGNLIQILENNTKMPQKIIVVFESMWGATARMADLIAHHIKESGVKAVLMDMKLTSLEKLAHEAVTATGFCFGSPTLNGGAMPAIIQAVNYMRGLKLVTSKPAIVFGSYGWGNGEGSAFIKRKLEQAGIKVMGRVVWKFNFNESSVEEMKRLIDSSFFGQK